MKKKKKLTRSETMSRIRSKDTGPELLLRKALFKQGMRFRIYAKNVMGKPDIYIKKYKLAIFVDSDFWHGRLYKEGKRIPKTNQDYWIPKLERNIARDISVTKQLKDNGWTVLRFWESDIYNNTEEIVNHIMKTFNKIKKDYGEKI